MNKDKYVYCTNCMYGGNLIEAITNGTNMPEQCGKCYPFDLESGVRYENRPNYKEKSEINKNS